VSRTIVPKASALFLLGAGFDIDANYEAGPVVNPYHGTKTDCGYPLVADILQLCFGRNELPAGKSIEQLFAEAKEANDIEPMERLVDRLMEADHYLARRLAISDTSNAYRDFFEKFSDAHFLTFNYDSLPEIYLHHHGRWYPEDGYGFAVKTELRFGVSLPPNRASTSLVLHLHGSACVFAEDFVIVGNSLEEVAQLVQRTEPLYAFDAHAMSDCFPHYGRVMLGTGFVRPEDRVIAPVPDTSEDLKQFAAPNPEKYIANRELGTIQKIDGSGIPSIRPAVVEPASECVSRTHKRSLMATKVVMCPVEMRSL
jgi:hypothetical protein